MRPFPAVWEEINEFGVDSGLVLRQTLLTSCKPSPWRSSLPLLGPKELGTKKDHIIPGGGSSWPALFFPARSSRTPPPCQGESADMKLGQSRQSQPGPTNISTLCAKKINKNGPKNGQNGICEGFRAFHLLHIIGKFQPNCFGVNPLPKKKTTGLFFGFVAGKLQGGLIFSLNRLKRKQCFSGSQKNT